MRRILLVATILALLVLLMTLLKPLIKSDSRGTELTAREFEQSTAAFARLLQGDREPGPELEQLQLTSNRRQQPFTGVLLEEQEPNARGQGIYAIRDAADRRPALLISAPHRGADIHTGPLAGALFIETGASAAAWNSVPRARRGKSEGLDLARLERHPFTAFAVAFALVHREGRVIQLHGFDPANRRTPAARESEVILSSASERPSAAVESIAACLTRSLPGYAVRVFPREVSELGALKNAQARVLRSLGHDVFVHIELSFSIRERLLEDQEFRSAFGECLVA